MTSNIFICFIGTDGSGKSTIAANTFEEIRRRKRIKVKKVYGRHLPFFTRYVLILGKRLFIKDNMFSNYDRYLDKKKSLYRRASKFVRIYDWLLIIEYYFQVLFKVIIPYRLGYSIISDRYVHDTIINDVAIDKGMSMAEVTKLLNKFWLFIPRPDITFLVRVPEEVAFKRKNDIPSLSYLKIRNKLYNELTITESIVPLDGTLAISELENKVFGEIDKVTRDTE